MFFFQERVFFAVSRGSSDENLIGTAVVFDSFKKRYSGEYEGMSTTELAGDLRRDVEHYRGLWRTARTADEKVTMNKGKRRLPWLARG